MARYRRKTLIAAAGGALSTLGVMRFPAQAAEFTYKIASDTPAAHPAIVRLNEATQEILKASNGRIEVRVFPGSVLGGTTAMVGLVRTGAVEFITGNDLTMGDLVPIAAISGLPFVFRSPAEALKVMQGPVGRYQRNAIANATGLHPLAVPYDYGFRELLNATRPINVPDDLKKIKFGITDSPMIVALWRALAAEIAVVQTADMYTSVQTHLVDAVDRTLVSAVSFKLYELLKYASMTNHVWTAGMLIANGYAWTRLPSGLRDMVEHNLNQAATLCNADVAQSAPTLETSLRSRGMVFNQADVPAFRDAVRRAGLYARFHDTYGPQVWALLEQSVGKLV